MSCTVSVIVPVVNTEHKSMLRCIESLNLGKYRNIEIILIDIGLTEQNKMFLKKILNECSENTSLVCVNSKNKMSYINDIIQNANGDYILFVNCNDWVAYDYISDMVNLAEQMPEYLIACGFKAVNSKREYLYNSGQQNITTAGKDQYFELMDCKLLEPVWNKIYKKEILIHHQISCDELVKTGYSFQFVLDYLEAFDPKGIVVNNKPLYYRSEMNAKKTADIRETELIQIQKLTEISGIPAVTETKKEFPQQQSSLNKKRVHGVTESIQRKINKIRNKVEREVQHKRVSSLRKKLFVQDVTIISQNCIGGVFYHDMQMQFLSPTINLFFYASDFVKFVMNLDYYLSLPFQWCWGEYPIGVLGDIKIYFMHYKSCKEAEDSWIRRCQRIKKDRILVIATDRQGFSEEVYQEWKRIEYSKILFTAKKEFVDEYASVYYPEYEEQGYVGDLIPKRLFYRDYKIIEKVNAFTE